MILNIHNSLAKANGTDGSRGHSYLLNRIYSFRTGMGHFIYDGIHARPHLRYSSDKYLSPEFFFSENAFKPFDWDLIEWFTWKEVGR